MNIIERQIRRCSRNLLALNLTIMAGLGAFAFYNRQYLYNCLAGPFPVSAQDLLRIYDAANTPRNFVSIANVTPLETGFRIIKQNEGQKDEAGTARFFAVSVGGRDLLIRSTSSQPASRYEGELVPIPILSARKTPARFALPFCAVPGVELCN